MEFERALVVFAHPDDAEFLCGGTVAKLVGDGTQVRYVCATDGSAGWNEPDRGRADVAEIRKREMREAAEVLGVADVSRLREWGARVTGDEDMELAEAFRTFRLED